MRAAARRCVDYQRLRSIDVAVLLGTAAGALAIGAAVNRALAALGLPASGVPFGLASGLVFIGLWAIVYHRRFTRLVFAELRDRGHPVCPVCGYYTGEGVRGAACPECGATDERPGVH